MIEVPEDKPLSALTTDERRSYMLDLYYEDPEYNEMNKTEKAKELGITIKTLYEDIKVIKAWIRENMETSIETELAARYKRNLDKMEEQDQYYKSNKSMKDFVGMLQDMGKLEKEPEKHEIQKDVSSTDIELNIVSDDEDDKTEFEK